MKQIQSIEDLYKVQEFFIRRQLESMEWLKNSGIITKKRKEAIFKKIKQEAKFMFFDVIQTGYHSYDVIRM